MATQALLRTISKVAGSEIVEDAMAFFRAFDGMEEGFRDRARGVEALLADPGTAFVLVAAPRRDSVAEAGFFADRLAEAHQPVAALIVNRLHPDFGAGEAGMDAGAGVAADARAAEAGELTKPAAAAALAGLRRNLQDLQGLADQERGYVATLESRIDGAVVKVPYLPKDVHDLGGLGLVAECLTGQVLSDRA
jgi:anion-transporting  ArsA/GET3 family ATPase